MSPSYPQADSETSVVEPDAKKAKLDLDDVEALLDTAWQHYRNYTDNDDAESDELEELLTILQPLLNNDNSSNTSSFSFEHAPRPTRRDLWPVLVSVASTVLAEEALAELLQLQQQESTTTTVSENMLTVVRQQLHARLTAAVTHCPVNAAAWSMAANYVRLVPSSSLSSSFVASMYRWAATCASSVRTTAVALLDEEEEEENEKGSAETVAKEWIEMLLLNQVTGVELMGDDDDEEDDDDKEHNEGETNEEAQNKEEAVMVDEWSTSAVEGTARFMLAMLESRNGKHDEAARQLALFDISHRLHPKLWSANKTPVAITSESSPSGPVAFQSPTGVVPPPLYQRLCQVFRPNAAYWSESGYENRGYYSYFMDLPTGPPTNLIDDIVGTHLLPLALQQLESTASPIVGYEWWVHTRPVAANLGHNLHFDTDETLLAQEQEITHPILSSVLYLTGGHQRSGATIVLDQNPESTESAGRVWYSIPRDNTLMVFPGDLLHGVLPCQGMETANTGPEGGVPHDSGGELLQSVTQLLQKEDLWTVKESSPPHRLTFMVGFWTRRVPDRMKDRRLYGPCGSIPDGKEHTWVQEIQKGYSGGEKLLKAALDVTIESLPFVTPAWDELPPVSKAAGKDDKFLDMPTSLDHRFFVANAPYCFRTSLFERDEFDDSLIGSGDSDGED